jgi:hypothetical protein
MLSPETKSNGYWSDLPGFSFSQSSNDQAACRRPRKILQRQNRQGWRRIAGAWKKACRPFEPFRKSADLSLLGDCNFQFYGGTAGRIYSAQVVLLFLSVGLNLFVPHTSNP